MKIRLATSNIQRDSIVDGEGIRCVIWTQGCPHNCKGCHNPETHSFDDGILVDIEDIKKKIDSLELHDGITFSGGDPMMQALACCEIAKYCHKKGLNVWCYTGYTYEQLIKMAQKKKELLDFLNEIDVLVDGKFEEEKKDISLRFRGSSNQRVIDVKKSLKDKKAVLFEF